MNENKNIEDIKSRWNLRSVLVVGLAAIVLSLSLVTFFLFKSDVTLPVAQPATTAIQAVATEEQIPELPTRLVIPAIDVDADIQHVGLDASGNGEMAVPSNFTDVGWYASGVRPGMSGSAVIAGHYNGREIPEAVFYDLSDLAIGDEIFVMSAARLENIFVVKDIVAYEFDAQTTEVFISTDGKKRLNLITCSGEWLANENQYNQRTVVFAELLAAGE